MSDELLDLVKMGIDAEAFLKTPLGKFLEGKAKREIEDATEELIATEANNFHANRDLRNRIHIGRMFLQWMNESIQIGRAAHEQILEQDE